MLEEMAHEEAEAWKDSKPAKPVWMARSLLDLLSLYEGSSMNSVIE